MKLGSYLQELDNQNSIQQKIANFFKKNTKPTDDQVHKFAESENIDKHKFEEIIYAMLGSFFGEGRSKDFKGEYDPKQLKMGIEVEYEHTTNPIISHKITCDHLAEFSDYYTRLAIMEHEAEEGE